MPEYVHKRLVSRALSVLIIIALFACMLSGCGQVVDEETPADTGEVIKISEAESSEEETFSEATSDTSETTVETTEETTEEQPYFTEPVNFYIFGVDTVGYTEVDKGRSDMIKLISIDTELRTIKSIGILRDSKVPIEGHDPQKINAAYMYGAAPLAMATLNTNFDLNVSSYIMINFSGLVILVDYIGGVDVEITADEAAEINWHDGDYVGDGRASYSIPVEEGLAHLDGSQALALCRTRKIDNDFFRAGRQNRTIEAIIEQIKNTPVTEYPELINMFFDCVVTNMKLEDITHLMDLDLGDYDFSSYRIPDEIYETDLKGGQDETGSWVWTYDLEQAGKRINAILDGTFAPADVPNDDYMKKY